MNRSEIAVFLISAAVFGVATALWAGCRAYRTTKQFTTPDEVETPLGTVDEVYDAAGLLTRVPGAAVAARGRRT
jgi:hypothetical protein